MTCPKLARLPVPSAGSPTSVGAEPPGPTAHRSRHRPDQWRESPNDAPSAGLPRTEAVMATILLIVLLGVAALRCAYWLIYDRPSP